MSPQNGPQTADSQVYDRVEGYGWISILAHWIVAAFVIALWFMGDSIGTNLDNAQRSEKVQLHVATAVIAYLLILGRIVWRWYCGYPRSLERNRLDRWAARNMHTVMLCAMSLMLLTGPLLAVTEPVPVAVFGSFELPAYSGFPPWVRVTAYQVHAASGITLILAICIHVSGACKHLMFDDDDVFIRMLLPRRNK